VGMVIKKWDVFLVNLDPTIGKEIRKTRPAVVVSPDEINAHWSPVTILPLTSNIRQLGFRTNVKFQEKEGQVAIDQIKAIDTSRILKKIGRLREVDYQKVQRDLLLFFSEEP